MAKWNKQRSSDYENLLLFFFPDAAVCLHVLTEKLNKISLLVSVPVHLNVKMYV